MGKVAIVGVEGSGKTVLMGALCECYKQGAKHEPYLMPENQAAFMFMERIPHLLRVERQWPEATSVSGLKSMRWTLRLGTEILEEIEMLDYPGELYRIAFGEHKKEEADAHREELNEFLEHLTSADSLIVLLNLADVQNLGANPRHAETVWITRGIFDYVKELPNIKRTTLVFTQADRYEEALQAAGGAKGLYAMQLPMLKTLYPDLKVMTVSAVSGTDADGRPKAAYSSVGCLDIMREILADHDTIAVQCLGLCGRCLARINEFSCGSAEHFSAEVTAYSNAVIEFAKASKPLMQIYSTQEVCHQVTVGDLSQMIRDINSLCSGASVDVLASSRTWEGLREKYATNGSVFDAFVKHYSSEVKRLNQLALEEEENARKRALEEEEKSRKRALQAAKNKRQMVIFSTVGALLLGGMIGVSYYCGRLEKEKAAEKEAARREAAIKEEEAIKLLTGKDWRSPYVGMEFVWVPALKLWVGKYEATNGEYRRKDPSHDSKDYEGRALNGGWQPAVFVNFDDAKAYAEWLTGKDKGGLNGLRYRVISETEWQTCAQCGDGREYPWGNSMPPKWGNYSDSASPFSKEAKIDGYTDGYAVTCPVEKSGANEWGVYGLGGNVWECCASDATGSSFGAWRGASWFIDYPDDLRCACRSYSDGSSRDSNRGFRLVLSRPSP